MANYRSLHTKFWGDSDVEKLGMAAKLLFVYLMTNSLRNEAALYNISLDMIAFQTKIPLSDVESAMDELSSRGKVHYDATSETVWVVNAVKYQTLNPNCKKSIARDIEMCSSTTLAIRFCERYKGHEGLETLCQRFLNGLVTVTHPLPNGSETLSKGLSDLNNPPIELEVELGLELGKEGDARGRGAPPLPTLDEVLEHCRHPSVSISDVFAADWYRSLFAAGWKDGDGNLIQGWERYLARSWANRATNWREQIKERQRKDEQDVPQERPPGQRDSPRTPHEQRYYERLVAEQQAQVTPVAGAGVGGSE